MFSLARTKSLVPVLYLATGMPLQISPRYWLLGLKDICVIYDTIGQRVIHFYSYYLISKPLPPRCWLTMQRYTNGYLTKHPLLYVHEHYINLS